MFLVLKIGGDLLAEGLPKSLVDELMELSTEHKIILIHGGGDIVTDIATS